MSEVSNFLIGGLASKTSPESSVREILTPQARIGLLLVRLQHEYEQGRLGNYHTPKGGISYRPEPAKWLSQDDNSYAALTLQWQFFRGRTYHTLTSQAAPSQPLLWLDFAIDKLDTLKARIISGPVYRNIEPDNEAAFADVVAKVSGNVERYFAEPPQAGEWRKY